MRRQSRLTSEEALLDYATAIVEATFSSAPSETPRSARRSRSTSSSWLSRPMSRCTSCRRHRAAPRHDGPVHTADLRSRSGAALRLTGAPVGASIVDDQNFRDAADNALTIDEIDPYAKISKFTFCAEQLEPPRAPRRRERGDAGHDGLLTRYTTCRCRGTHRARRW